MRTFLMGEGHEKHEAGNPACPACWQQSPNKCGCGGLVHLEFMDEWSDGEDEGLMFYERCDKCSLTDCDECKNQNDPDNCAMGADPTDDCPGFERKP